MTPALHLKQLEINIAPLHTHVVAHPLFEQITNLEHLRCFMAQHVFAVWDFVCLLKTLYNTLACTTVPWLPPPHTESVYLIGQIMNEEEADHFLTKNNQPRCCSHFEAYLTAMQTCDANTQPIINFLTCLRVGEPLSQALQNPDVPFAARLFVQETFAVFDKPAHQIAAAFVFGREGITGDLFSRLLAKDHPEQFPLPSSLKQYLQRHIDLDTDSHYPKALQMLQNLCGNEAQKWGEATHAAVQALQSRQNFWTGIAECM